MARAKNIREDEAHVQGPVVGSWWRAHQKSEIYPEGLREPLKGQTYELDFDPMAEKVSVPELHT